MNQRLVKKESTILMGWGGKYLRKLDEFRKLVTDEASYDIKAAEGGEFSTKSEKAFKKGYAFFSYSDEDKDNYMIRQGFKYYDKHFKK